MVSADGLCTFLHVFMGRNSFSFTSAVTESKAIKEVGFRGRAGRGQLPSDMKALPAPESRVHGEIEREGFFFAVHS